MLEALSVRLSPPSPVATDRQPASRAQSCSSVSSLSHSTFLLEQFFTDKKLATTEDRHCRTPMKNSIVILILRSKQYDRVVAVLIKSLEMFAFSLVSK